MKAAIRVEPGRIEIKDVPEPAAEPGRSLVRVDAVSLCGSDLHYYRGPMPWHETVPGEDAPFIVCHEMVGTVVDSPDPSPWSPGDRVVLDPQHRCRKCPACRAGDIELCPERLDMGYSADGVAAGFVVADNDRLIGVPPEVPPDVAAATHGFAAPLHALGAVDLSAVRRALVTGPGPAGLMFAMALLAKLEDGEVSLAGRRSPRLDIARRVGAQVIELGDHGLADAAFDWHRDSGFDLVVDTTGAAPVIEQAVACLAPRGTLLLYAPTSFTLDGNAVFRRELRVVGSTGAHRGMTEAVQLISSGRVPLAEIITHRFPLTEIEDAFRMAMAGPGNRGDFLKGVVLMDPAAATPGP
jgi:2-desacetyl-2-hydroxyethyl bacteriochlorophyllide A dehydrogenase